MSCEAVGRIRIGSLETPQAVEEAIESLVEASSDIDDGARTCSAAQVQHFEESVNTVAAAIRRLPSDQIHQRIGLPIENVSVPTREAALRIILVERAIQPPRRGQDGRDLNAGTLMTEDLCVAQRFFRADPELYRRHLTDRNTFFEHRNEANRFAIQLHVGGSHLTDAELTGIMREAGHTWLFSQLRYSLDGIRNRGFGNRRVPTLPLYMESQTRAAEATDSLLFQTISQDRERMRRLSLQAASTPAPDVIQEASSVLMESHVHQRRSYRQRLMELNGMSQEQLIGVATEQVLDGQRRLAQWQQQLITTPDIPHPTTPEQLLETTLIDIVFAARGVGSVVLRNALTQLTGHEPSQRDLENILSHTFAAMTSTPWDDLMSAAQAGEVELLCREDIGNPAPGQDRRLLQQRATSEAVTQPTNVTEADISRWLGTGDLIAIESVARDPNRYSWVRLDAIEALADAEQTEEAISILESLAQNSHLDNRYRVAAVSALAMTGEDAATSTIASFVRNSRNSVHSRESVIENIANSELLMSLSRDRRLPVGLRRTAIWQLSLHDDDENLESLAQDPGLPRSLRSFAGQCLGGDLNY